MNSIIKIMKCLLIYFLPMGLIYLLNIIIFNNKHTNFLMCFVSLGLYVRSMVKVKSIEKILTVNWINNENKPVYAKDKINLMLFVTLILVLCFFIQVLLNKISKNSNDLTWPFGDTAIILVIISHFKIPKRLFS